MLLKVQDLIVYQRLCDLHLRICELTRSWPVEEKYELAGQVRKSSNSSPAQLAEKHNDRHVRNKIEGVNRSRGEANETVHHLFIASLKGYLTRAELDSFSSEYEECIRMLNGLEKKLERQLPISERQWPANLPEP